MSLVLAACNMRESLAEPHHMPEAVEHIKEMDADVVVLGDAYSLTNTLHGSTVDALEDARARLAVAGYGRFETEYDDEDPWHHDRNLMMLSRIALDFMGVRLATRNAVEGKTRSTLKIVGAHFDDRNEQTRMRQAHAFLEQYDADQPVVLAGDLNSLSRGDRLVAILGSGGFRTLTGLIPGARARNLAFRSVEMASGATMALLEDGGFGDADAGGVPTFPASRPLFRPDHIIASRAAVGISDFQVIEPGGSYTDHRILRARINW